MEGIKALTVLFFTPKRLTCVSTIKNCLPLISPRGHNPKWQRWIQSIATTVVEHFLSLLKEYSDVGRYPEHLSHPVTPRDFWIFLL